MVVQYRDPQFFEVPNKKVIIIQTDMVNLSCTGRETGQGPTYTISLKYGNRNWYHPTIGEEWIIVRSQGYWVLDRRTDFQNNAALLAKTSNPGDWIMGDVHPIVISAAGDITTPAGTLGSGGGSGSGFKYIGPTTPVTTGWSVNDIWYDTSTE